MGRHDQSKTIEGLQMVFDCGVTVRCLVPFSSTQDQDHLCLSFGHNDTSSQAGGFQE
jgi:hypothetical protein